MLQPDGTLRSWGYNVHGQLGVGNTTNQLTAQIPSGNHVGVVKLIAHDLESSAWILKSDGTIYSTGYNGYGQLGFGDVVNRNVFTKIQMDDNLEFKDIQSFGENTKTVFIAVDKDNRLWGCGYNAQWTLGLNHTYSYKTVLTLLDTSK